MPAVSPNRAAVRVMDPGMRVLGGRDHGTAIKA
jgi:hypothetical protein